MENILNITNRNSAVVIMKKAKIEGVFLPWEDVLHDGPVPENLSLEDLSEVRIQFIIRRNWGKLENIRKLFVERDNELKSFDKYEKVILWFEHDLYDQLQILQILDWFHSNPKSGVKLSIICTEKYLGMLSSIEMKALMKHEELVTERHLLLCNKAWSAFRSSSPEKWQQLLNIDTSVLPFLEGAIVRMLEEYPNCSNGLSRTAHQALKIISEGEKYPEKVFARYQESEVRIFLGDASFWVILQELLDSSPALLMLPKGTKLTLPATREQEITITPIGLDVLSGKRNWLEITNLDRWIGGVHLENTNLWCWNPNSREIVKKA